MSTTYKPRHRSRSTRGEARPPRRSLDAVSPAPCTYCGALPGWPCTDNGGQLHTARWLSDTMRRLREGEAS